MIDQQAAKQVGVAAPFQVHVAQKRNESSVAKLISHAQETTIPWIVEDLWQDGGIALVHSLEGEFKSVLSYQIAEAIAAGSQLLRLWDAAQRSSNQLVRGSNRLVEDASLVIHLRRLDKAANKVSMEVGKLRNGPKPEPIELWFDAGTFRLTPLPPIVALLEYGSLSRQDLIAEAQRRFSLKERAVDEHRARLTGCLDETKEGHQRILCLNRQFKPDPDTEAAKWWKLVRKPAAPA